MQLPPSTDCTFVSVNATILHLQSGTNLGPSEHAYLTSLPPLRTDRLRLSGVYIELMWAAALPQCRRSLAKTSSGLRIDISFHLSNAAAPAMPTHSSSSSSIVHRVMFSLLLNRRERGRGRRSTWLFQRRRHCNLTDAAFLEFQTPAENCSFLSFSLAPATASPLLSKFYLTTSPPGFVFG